MVARAKKSLEVLELCLMDIMNCSSKFSILRKDHDDVQRGHLKVEATNIKVEAKPYNLKP